MTTADDESVAHREGTPSEDLKLEAALARRRKWSIEIPSPHPQLTIKAVTAGCLVGIICSFLALYYGLKTGITPSLNILSGLGGFVLLKGFMTVVGRCGWKIARFTPQENAVLQTAAVATYSVSGFGFASGYLAMSRQTCELLNLKDLQDDCDDSLVLSWQLSFVWCIALAFFGFFIAFPLREYCVLKQRLLFPSGTATAYVIKTMHASADKANRSFAILTKYFSMAFLVNIITWCFKGLAELPIFGMKADYFGWQLDFDLGSIGIGMLLGNKIGISLGIGGIVAHGILRPLLEFYRLGTWIKDPPPSRYLGSLCYPLFAGLGIMVIQGVYSIIMLSWVLFSESKFGQRLLAKCLKRKVSEADSDLPIGKKLSGITATSAHLAEAADEAAEAADLADRQAILDEIFHSSNIPQWIPPLGYVIFGVLCMLVMHFLFKTAWYQVLVALIIIPLFAISNIQGIGRTDWDVSSAYGKLMMFPFGLWNKGSTVIPSLVLCIVTICGCSNAGVLMQDFKTGYLLGSSPSIMFVAQSIGQLFGCVVTPSLFLLLTSAFEIPTDDKSAFITGLYGPIYRTLALVATRGGFDMLPTYCLEIALGFCVLTVLLDILDVVLPERITRYLPDPTAFGIGMLIPASVGLNFLLGAFIRTFWTYYKPATCNDQTPYIASGLVAGSGIAVVLQAVVSLANLSGPISLKWSQTPNMDKSVGPFIMGAVTVLICAAVLACGLYYWFPPALSELESTKGSTAGDKDDDGSVAVDVDSTSKIEDTMRSRGYSKIDAAATRPRCLSSLQMNGIELSSFVHQ